MLHEEFSTAFDQVFDCDAFKNTFPASTRPFVDALVRTQTFAKYVEEHTYASSRPSDLAFFAHCCQVERDGRALLQRMRVKHGPKARLPLGAMFEHRVVESQEQSRAGATCFDLPAPSAAGLPGCLGNAGPDGGRDNTQQPPCYVYPVFPRLDLSLFLPPRDVEANYHALLNEARCQSLETALQQAKEGHSSLDAFKVPRVLEAPIAWAKAHQRSVYSVWFLAYHHSLTGLERNRHDLVMQAMLVLEQMTRHTDPDECVFRSLLGLCGKFSYKVRS